jgi:DNA-binding MarR family transcriptional regulator
MAAPVDAYACARAWAALSSAHARVSERLSAELARACGLSINDFEVLLRLDHVAPAGLRLGELQPAVRLTQPSLSRMVIRLEQHGWLARAGAPDDRRGVLVTITEAGQAVLRKAMPVHAGVISEVLLNRLAPAEQEQLADVLGRISAGPQQTV